ncbi:MAG TPA: glycosyltransferase 87 family protein [Solirubrobacterales bacterium]
MGGRLFQGRAQVSGESGARAIVALAGLVGLATYLGSRLPEPAAHWPLWDVSVYHWAGAQVVRGAALYARSAPYHFTYPPLDGALFGIAGESPAIALKIAISVASVGALIALSVLSLGAAGLRRRPDLVVAVAALALLTVPVVLTLHLGETDLIVTALVATDVLRRRDGGRFQGVGVGLAAAIKLTPLIFVVYLAATNRMRAAAVAAGTFAATVAIGFLVLPADSRTFWLGGVFLRSRRVGNAVDLTDQSLAGAIARLAGGSGQGLGWWYAAAALTAIAGLAVAVWAHRRGHRLAGAVCCGITGLLVSPISWTHHWVWAVPLLVLLFVAAWRRRSWWIGTAAVLTALVFSAAAALPSTWGPFGVGDVFAANAYVWCGAAVLVGTFILLYQEATGLRSSATP